MPELSVVAIKDGKMEEVDPVTLSERVFGGRVNEHLIWEAVRSFQASSRRGTAKVKGRGEVSGSGRKLWRQKGTGRARVGSIRSPLWRKGGTVHGPQPRSYAYRLPGKAYAAAIRSALSQKASEGRLRLVSDLALKEAKTREAARIVKALGVEGSCLLVTAEQDETLALATRNLPKVAARPVRTVRLFDIVSSRTMVMTAEAARKIDETYGKC